MNGEVTDCGGIIDDTEKEEGKVMHADKNFNCDMDRHSKGINFFLDSSTIENSSEIPELVFDKNMSNTDIERSLLQISRSIFREENPTQFPDNSVLSKILNYLLSCIALENIADGIFQTVANMVTDVLNIICEQNPRDEFKFPYSTYENTLNNIVGMVKEDSSDVKIHACCLIVKNFMLFINKFEVFIGDFKTSDLYDTYAKLFKACNNSQVKLSLFSIVCSLVKENKEKNKVHDSAEKHSFNTLLATLFPFIVCEDRTVRGKALEIFQIATIEKCEDNCEHFVVPVMKRCIGKLETFISEHNPEWSCMWCVMFDITCIFSLRKDIMSSLLAAISRAFKSSDVNVRCEAFQKCWKHVIGTDIEGFTNNEKKKDTLCLKPFMTNNILEDEKLCKAKIEVFWYWLQCYQNRPMCILESIIPVFLEHCFGPWSSTPNISDWNIPLFTYLEDVNNSTNYFRAKNSIELRKMCGDALCKILKHEKAPSKDRTYCVPDLNISELQCPQNFLKISKFLIFSVCECTVSLSESDIDVVEEIWGLLMCHIKEVLSPENKQKVREDKATQMIKYLFKILKSVADLCKENSKLTNVLLNPILENVLFGTFALPECILLSPQYNIESSTIISTPVIFILDILLTSHIVEGIEEKGKLIEYVSFLINMGMSNGSAILKFTLSLMKKIEQMSSLLGNDEQCHMWMVVVNNLCSYMDGRNEVNEGTDVCHDFTTMYTVLMYPVQYLQPSVEKMQIFEDCWQKFIDKFCKCFYLVPYADVNEIGEHVCKKWLELNRKSPLTPLQIRMVSFVLSHIINHIPFHGLYDTPVTKTRLYPAKPKIKPLKKLEYLIKLLFELLSWLHKFSCDDLYCYVMINLAQCLDTLLSNVSQDITPLIAKLLPHILPFLQVQENRLNCDKKRKLLSLWSTLLKVFTDHLQSIGVEKCFFLIMESTKNSVFRNATCTFFRSNKCQNSKLAVSEALNKCEGFALENDSIEENSFIEEVGSEAQGHVSLKLKNIELLTQKTEQKEFSPSKRETATCTVAELFNKTPVAKTPVKRRPLTAYQKEMLCKRRDNIPALYSDLSQDSQLIMELSQDESSLEVINSFQLPTSFPAKDNTNNQGGTDNDTSSANAQLAMVSENAVSSPPKMQNTKITTHFDMTTASPNSIIPRSLGSYNTDVKQDAELIPVTIDVNSTSFSNGILTSSEGSPSSESIDQIKKTNLDIETDVCNISQISSPHKESDDNHETCNTTTDTVNPEIPITDLQEDVNAVADIIIDTNIRLPSPSQLQDSCTLTGNGNHELSDKNSLPKKLHCQDDEYTICPKRRKCNPEYNGAILDSSLEKYNQGKADNEHSKCNGSILDSEGNTEIANTEIYTEANCNADNKLNSRDIHVDLPIHVNPILETVTCVNETSVLQLRVSDEERTKHNLCNTDIIDFDITLPQENITPVKKLDSSANVISVESQVAPKPVFEVSNTLPEKESDMNDTVPVKLKTGVLNLQHDSTSLINSDGKSPERKTLCVLRSGKLKRPRISPKRKPRKRRKLMNKMNLASPDLTKTQKNLQIKLNSVKENDSEYGENNVISLSVRSHDKDITVMESTDCLDNNSVVLIPKLSNLYIKELTTHRRLCGRTLKIYSDIKKNNQEINSRSKILQSQILEPLNDELLTDKIISCATCVSEADLKLKHTEELMIVDLKNNVTNDSLQNGDIVNYKDDNINGFLVKEKELQPSEEFIEVEMTDHIPNECLKNSTVNEEDRDISQFLTCDTELNQEMMENLEIRNIHNDNIRTENSNAYENTTSNLEALSVDLNHLENNSSTPIDVEVHTSISKHLQDVKANNNILNVLPTEKYSIQDEGSSVLHETENYSTNLNHNCLPSPRKSQFISPVLVSPIKKQIITPALPFPTMEQLTTREMPFPAKQQIMSPSLPSPAKQHVITPELPSRAKKQVIAPALPSPNKQQVISPELPSLAQQYAKTPELPSSALPSPNKQQVTSPALSSAGQQHAITPVLPSPTKQHVITLELPFPAKQQAISPELPSPNKKQVISPALPSTVQQLTIIPVFPSTTKQQVITPELPSPNKQQVTSPVLSSSGQQHAITPALPSPTKQHVITLELPFPAKQQVISPQLPSPNKQQVISPELPSLAQQYAKTPILLSPTKQQVITPELPSSAMPSPNKQQVTCTSPALSSPGQQHAITPVLPSPIKQHTIAFALPSPAKQQVIAPELPSPIKQQVMAPALPSPIKQQAISPVSLQSASLSPPVSSVKVSVSSPSQLIFSPSLGKCKVRPKSKHTDKRSRRILNMLSCASTSKEDNYLQDFRNINPGNLENICDIDLSVIKVEKDFSFIDEVNDYKDEYESGFSKHVYDPYLQPGKSLLKQSPNKPNTVKRVNFCEPLTEVSYFTLSSHDENFLLQCKKEETVRRKKRHDIKIKDVLHTKELPTQPVLCKPNVQKRSVPSLYDLSIKALYEGRQNQHSKAGQSTPLQDVPTCSKSEESCEADIDVLFKKHKPSDVIRAALEHPRLIKSSNQLDLFNMLKPLSTILPFDTFLLWLTQIYKSTDIMSTLDSEDNIVDYIKKFTSKNLRQ